MTERDWLRFSTSYHDELLVRAAIRVGREMGGTMYALRCVMIALAWILTASSIGYAQSNTDQTWDEIKRLDWQFNGVGPIGAEASIQIPADHAFLGSAGTRRFLELNGNLPSDNKYTIAPQDLHWFGVFGFEPTGYVADNEKLDPDSLLEKLKSRNIDQQAEMRRRGLTPLVLVGWFVEPHYDLVTKRLEWGTRLRTETGETVVNYMIKILGRRGVMDAVLVSEPQALQTDIREFKTTLQGYTYDPGERYSEFRSGDKVAEYGLSALIIGGAAAAAVKTGAFKGLAKLLGIGAIAVVGAIGGFFKRLFRRA